MLLRKRYSVTYFINGLTVTERFYTKRGATKFQHRVACNGVEVGFIRRGKARVS